MKYISKIQKNDITCDFIVENADLLDSHTFSIISDSSYIRLNNGILKIFANDLNWSKICRTYTLKEDLIEQFRERMGWYNIIVYQDLSENLMDKYYDELLHNIFWIGKYQNLSQKFIEKHYDDLYNDFIWGYQKTNLVFKLKHFKSYFKCLFNLY